MTEIEPQSEIPRKLSIEIPTSRYIMMAAIAGHTMKADELMPREHILMALRTEKTDSSEWDMDYPSMIQTLVDAKVDAVVNKAFAEADDPNDVNIQQIIAQLDIDGFHEQAEGDLVAAVQYIVSKAETGADENKNILSSFSGGTQVGDPSRVIQTLRYIRKLEVAVTALRRDDSAQAVFAQYGAFGMITDPAYVMSYDELKGRLNAGEEIEHTEVMGMLSVDEDFLKRFKFENVTEYFRFWVDAVEMQEAHSQRLGDVSEQYESVLRAEMQEKRDNAVEIAGHRGVSYDDFVQDVYDRRLLAPIHPGFDYLEDYRVELEQEITQQEQQLQVEMQPYENMEFVRNQVFGERIEEIQMMKARLKGIDGLIQRKGNVDIKEEQRDLMDKIGLAPELETAIQAEINLDQTLQAWSIRVKNIIDNGIFHSLLISRYIRIAEKEGGLQSGVQLRRYLGVPDNYPLSIEQDGMFSLEHLYDIINVPEDVKNTIGKLRVFDDIFSALTKLPANNYGI